MINSTQQPDLEPTQSDLTPQDLLNQGEISFEDYINLLAEQLKEEGYIEAQINRIIKKERVKLVISYLEKTEG